MPSSTRPSPDAAPITAPVTVDCSAVETVALRDALRESLEVAALDVFAAPIEVRSGAFGADSWLHASDPFGRVILLTDLTPLDRAITPETAPDWLARMRRVRPWVVAFVRTRDDRRRAHRADGLMRALDGRFTLLPEPDDPLGPILKRWFANVLPLLAPEALIAARPARSPNGAGSGLSLRFGDDWAPNVSLEALQALGAIEADGERLRLDAVTCGPGGRSLRIPRSDPGSGPIIIDADALRGALEDAGFGAGMDDRPTNRSVGRSDPMPLGENLRRIRTERGLSQSELGEMAGLHQSVISNLERNVHSPRLETLKRVAGALELSVPGLTVPEDEPAGAPD